MLWPRPVVAATQLIKTTLAKQRTLHLTGAGPSPGSELCNSALWHHANEMIFDKNQLVCGCCGVCCRCLLLQRVLLLQSAAAGAAAVCAAAAARFANDL